MSGKSINPYKYLLAYTVPLVVFISLWLSNWYSYFAVVFVFGMVPFMELFTTGSTKNLTEEEERQAKANKLFDYILHGLVPVQYFLLVFFLIQVSNPDLSTGVKIGLMLAFGISCGVIGINGAHELGHRTTKHEQLMSKLLLLTSQYMHFFIEHNRGHHRNVSTDEDPASSRYGETVYAFYVRSIIYSWISAWKLERERLSIVKKPFWSLHNEMLVYQLVQALFLTVIYLTFGFETLLYYWGAAFIGILLLETVNYIEHYGLRRKKKGKGYERTMPIHSWNSNHPLGRLFLLELSRHSDHHYIASRKYQLLRHHEESPQMPTGYPGMMVLSLFPPLWFRVIHKAIDNYKATVAGKDLD